jgi:DNA repair protein RadC
MNYRVVRTSLPLVREAPTKKVRSPEEALRVFRDLADLAQESFHVASLDAKHGLLNRHMVTLGLADASLVRPLEVFRPALLDGACAVMLAHNHPSGDVSPSSEDVRITKQLVQAGRLLDVRVMDHLILGPGKAGGPPAMLSMREAGLCDFG